MIEITVKREPQGLVSRWLHDELKVGDEVEIEAPNGTFVFNGEQAESVVLIGAGVGITPMMSVARYLTETAWPGKVSLILGFRAPARFHFSRGNRGAERPQPESQRHRNDEQPGRRARGPAGVAGSIRRCSLQRCSILREGRVHICGPPSMMDAVKAALLGLGVAESQVRTEAFGTVTRDPTAKERAIQGNRR